MCENLLQGVRNIHFIGIGGSGMVAVVQILKEQGYNITGSDNNESDVVRLVRSLNIKVFMKQEAKNIEGADLIIYTAAILDNNEELLAAKKSGIKLVERNDFLGYFTKKYDNAICVCGTHGKTTTTSMLTQILLEAKKNPTAIIGGKLQAINGYARLGNSNNLVCEACEFKDHFLKLFPDIVVVLNIDNDHLDYFKNMDNLKNSFRKFCEKATDRVIYNGDDKNTVEVVENINKNKISFGFGNNNLYYILNVRKEFGVKTIFDLARNGSVIVENMQIFVPGDHNILNAAAAAVTALENGVEKDYILSALKNFKGAGRRFEFVGKVNGAVILDDYAHHPREIYATLKALREYSFKRIWVIHQPFTFSRTAMLKQDFKKALSLADKVVITDIMGSREENKTGLNGKDLADILPQGVYCASQNEAAEYVKSNLKDGDVVITMGCGDIYKCAKIIVYGEY